MKELGITKGETFVLRNQPVQRNGFYIETDSVYIGEVGGGYLTLDQYKAIGELLIDGANTAQKCGLLPSELLQQRDELKEALISLMWQFAYYGTKNNVAVMHTGGLSALEDAFSALGLSDPITVENFEAAIKNTETK
jgi:hypothetical protein